MCCGLPLWLAASSLLPRAEQGPASCGQLLHHLCLLPRRGLPQRLSGSSLLADAVQVLRPQHAQVQDIARLFPGLTSLNLSGGCLRSLHVIGIAMLDRAGRSKGC